MSSQQKPVTHVSLILIVGLTCGLVWSDYSASDAQHYAGELDWGQMGHGLMLGILLSFSGLIAQSMLSAWSRR
jgi:hypothetical protein